ncbi:MAG: class I SAM-dependent methyltransferase [Terriglobia bacterium]
MATKWNAGLYDSKHTFVWRMGAGVLEMLKPMPGERILDIGCGTGHLTAQIDAAGAHVLGIDSSAAMIEAARKNFPRLKFEVMDARNFRFDKPFDAVFSNAALHWITQPERVAECVSNALKPGGRFVAEFGGKGNVQKLVEAFCASLNAVGAHSHEDPNPWYFPGIAEYSALIEKCGLEVTRAALIDRPTPLEDGESGLRVWIRMFAGSFYSAVTPGREDDFIENTENLLRPVLFRDGTWYLDCRRLRIEATKPVLR